MSKKLFIGNLSWSITQEELLEMFSAYGEVEDAFILKDQFKRSKGFGFVTFTNDSDADTAIAEMHEKEVGGRPLIVNEARPQQPRS